MAQPAVVWKQVGELQHDVNDRPGSPANFNQLLGRVPEFFDSPLKFPYYLELGGKVSILTLKCLQYLLLFQQR
jgi:hypothetical protein